VFKSVNEMKVTNIVEDAVFIFTFAMETNAKSVA